jgi:hypothetical protein
MSPFGLTITTATVVALAAAGCGDRAVVRVQAEPGRYEPGDSVVVVAANVSRQQIALANLCLWRLERADGPAWPVVAHSPTACALIARPLFPGERATTAIHLPARLPPGRYRVEFPWLTRERGVLAETERRTAPFELR